MSGAIYGEAFVTHEYDEAIAKTASKALGDALPDLAVVIAGRTRAPSS